jgi:hypothetical protein
VMAIYNLIVGQSEKHGQGIKNKTKKPCTLTHFFFYVYK